MKKVGVVRIWGVRISYSISLGRGDEGYEQGGCYVKEEGEDVEDSIGLVLMVILISNNIDALGEKG